MEYLIGDFSRISRLSIKTLRYYHEIGLLKPTRVDPFSGYRYYNEASLSRARAINRLRELDFSLGEIEQILAAAQDENTLLAYMRSKLTDVEQTITDYQRIRGRIEAFIQTELAPAAWSGQVEEKQLADQWVASVRYLGKYSQSGEMIEVLYQAGGLAVCGRPFSLYYDEQPMQDQADVEVCLPLQPETRLDGVQTRWLPGGRAWCVLHQGPYEKIWMSYRVLVDALNARGLRPLAPTREVYLKGPDALLAGDPQTYLTEIQFRVE
jgi:DNA-binding transcriptional MerR regulator/effector-binding domain-containing protein